jgi:hypothetical protein
MPGTEFLAVSGADPGQMGYQVVCRGGDATVLKEDQPSVAS